MPQLPTLGERPKKSPIPKVIGFALVVGFAAGGGYWFAHRKLEPKKVVIADPTTDQPMPPPITPPAAEPARAPAAPSPAAPKPNEPRTLSVAVDGPLETAITSAVGRDVGAPLTQVVTRALVWWLNIPGDLRRGDRLDAVFEERPGEEPLVHAVRFQSSKLAKTFEAYRFRPAGEKFARFYQPNGEELEQRLADAPLDDYEQITSLLRDGRRHKGVDFKAPVGTPVRATFHGVVTKRNWAFRTNGNSLEITEQGGQGRRAIFLHLSELPPSVRQGMHVKKGDVIAESGNTGRSFAPHLHYQLMAASNRVLDPFESHKTYRRSISSNDKAALDAEAARLSALMSREVAGAR